MSPKHKLITLSWCIATMLATMILSHGHLIMKEILAHWPTESSWEGRLESALYTQGGLAVLASLLLSAAMMIKGYFAKQSSEDQTRRELALRERHERAAAQRHEALLNSLTALSSGSQFTTSQAGRNLSAAGKKLQDSGSKPR